MIVHVKPEFCQLTEYCHQNDIPVVFWCKEDPVWNDAFMAAAGLADYIFTTEIDCIAQYKKNLGNDNVYFYISLRSRNSIILLKKKKG